MTVMVQSTITDADTGDTLTWSVMSNMETYATAMVDDMGMITVTGEAPGTAMICLLYTSPSPRDRTRSRMPSSA